MSTYYLTAGLIARDTGTADVGISTYYITAGLIPNDLPQPEPTTYEDSYINHIAGSLDIAMSMN